MSENKRTTVGTMLRFNSAKPGVGPRSPTATRDVRDVTSPSESHVVADSETMEIARPSTEIQADRQYLLAVEAMAADTVRNHHQGIR